jgi:hypothetical protein
MPQHPSSGIPRGIALAMPTIARSSGLLHGHALSCLAVDDEHERRFVIAFISCEADGGVALEEDAKHHPVVAQGAPTPDLVLENMEGQAGVGLVTFRRRWRLIQGGHRERPFLGEKYSRGKIDNSIRIASKITV